MANTVHTITIPSSTRYLEDVRRFVERHALAADFADDIVTALQIAVDEACANVIEHAYRGDDANSIEVDIIIKPDRLTVRIRDEGAAFDSTYYEEPNIFEFAHRRKSGGFGVKMIHKLMDHVEYRTRGRSNECCMTKYRDNHTP